jgi:hypothetical protein
MSPGEVPHLRFVKLGLGLVSVSSVVNLNRLAYLSPIAKPLNHFVLARSLRVLRVLPLRALR